MSIARTFILRGPEQAKMLHGFLRQNWVAMAQAGKPLAVDVHEHKAKRSGQQNRRYWALLRFIAANAWVAGKQFGDEAWHEHWKRTLIGTEDLPRGGVAGISTTSLSVGEFAEYMDAIERVAAQELGLDMQEFV